MSRTIRIYNIQHLKKTHRLVLNELPPSMANMNDEERLNYLNNSFRHSVHQYGFFYRKYGQICMGRCPFCRDHSKDQKIQRKRRKVEFRRILPEEVNLAQTNAECACV